MEKVTLGKKYTDETTTFTGVATSRCEYLHGKPRVALTAMIDGEPKEFWFEEESLMPGY